MTKAEMIKALEAYKDEEEIVVSNKWTTVSVEEVESIENHCTIALNKRITYLEDKVLGMSLRINAIRKNIKEAEEHLAIKETKKWRKILNKNATLVSNAMLQYSRYNIDLNVTKAMTWEDYRKEHFFY